MIAGFTFIEFFGGVLAVIFLFGGTVYVIGRGRNKNDALSDALKHAAKGDQYKND